MPKPDTRQSAIALAYGGANDAPRVVAKGRGLIAQAIIERAQNGGDFVASTNRVFAQFCTACWRLLGEIVH